MRQFTFVICVVTLICIVLRPFKTWKENNLIFGDIAREVAARSRLHL